MPLALEKPSRLCLTVALLAAVTACSGRHGPTVAQRGLYKVGAPYTIDGVTYVPTEEFQHVETGMASWYGPGFHGKYTANGEVYDQTERTAAHRTLQMPSVLRVTNLETGQSTVVRVNDRGPFARSRVLDVSRTAAEELGMVGRGTARVRIEQLEQESQLVKQIALNGGGPDEQRAALARPIATPTVAVAQAPAALPPPAQAPSPATPPVTVYPSSPRPSPPAEGPGFSTGQPTVGSIAAAATSAQPAGGFYVQTGAFSSVGNAEKQRGLVTSYGSTEISPASSGGREVYRVRVGPYSTQEAAGIVADRLRRSGYGDARVVAD